MIGQSRMFGLRVAELCPSQFDGAPHTFSFQRSHDRVGSSFLDLSGDVCCEARLLEENAPRENELHRTGRAESLRACDPVPGEAGRGSAENVAGDWVTLLERVENFPGECCDVG